MSPVYWALMGWFVVTPVKTEEVVLHSLDPVFREAISELPSKAACEEKALALAKTLPKPLPEEFGLAFPVDPNEPAIGTGPSIDKDGPEIQPICERFIVPTSDGRPA